MGPVRLRDCTYGSACCPTYDFTCPTHMHIHMYLLYLAVMFVLFIVPKDTLELFRRS
jgi:hypothetical protein